MYKDITIREGGGRKKEGGIHSLSGDVTLDISGDDISGDVTSVLIKDFMLV